MKLRGTYQVGQRTDQPVLTVTAGGTHVDKVKTMFTVEGFEEEDAADAKIHALKLRCARQ
ncbi:hypothetical protein D4N07_11565 [Enterobacter hormaechei]|nr:hypothetical protein D4N07_11565 [Enterobacter hormaechei]